MDYYNPHATLSTTGIVQKTPWKIKRKTPCDGTDCAIAGCFFEFVFQLLKIGMIFYLCQCLIINMKFGTHINEIAIGHTCNKISHYIIRVRNNLS